VNCCSSNNQPCCKVESVVSVDERGQMVLPKEIREKANIRAGDKLAIVNCGQGGGIACLALIKVEDLNKMVQEMLGPVLKETFK
jgi:antitoxin PrlF